MSSITYKKVPFQRGNTRVRTKLTPGEGVDVSKL